MREANRDGRTTMEDRLLVELGAGHAYGSGTRPAVGSIPCVGVATGVTVRGPASRVIASALASPRPPRTERGQCEVFAEYLYNYLAQLPADDTSMLRENFNLDALGVSRDPSTGTWYVSFGSGDHQLLDDNPAIDDLVDFMAQAEAAGIRTFGIGLPSSNEG